MTVEMSVHLDNSGDDVDDVAGSDTSRVCAQELAQRSLLGRALDGASKWVAERWEKMSLPSSRAAAEAKRSRDCADEAIAADSMQMAREKRAFTGMPDAAAAERRDSRFEFVAARKSGSRLKERMSLQLRRLRRQDKDTERKALGRRGEGVQTVPHVRDIPAYARMLQSSDPVAQVEAAEAFRKLLQVETGAPIQQVIDAGVVPRLVDLLADFENPQLQLEAGWALTNIASGTAHQTKEVVDAQAIPALKELLFSQDENVRDQAIWALGNIAGDSFIYRDQVLEAGVLEVLLEEILVPQFVNERSLETATWTMLNMVRSKPSPDFDKVKCALPRILQLLHLPNKVILKDSCWACAALSENGEDQCISAVISSGVMDRCVKLLSHQNQVVVTPALRTVGNVCTGSDAHTQAVITAGAIPLLGKLAGSPNRMIRKEACWTLSNITAGSSVQVQAVIDGGIFPILVNVIENDLLEVAKEAVWAIANATAGGNAAQVGTLVANFDLLRVLSDCLKRQSQDPVLLNISLEGIENIMKVCLEGVSASSRELSRLKAAFVRSLGRTDLFTVVEVLRTHENPQIQAIADRILQHRSNI